MQDIFKEEKKLYKRGYKCIVGLDEAGRGPLAGPVSAAAVAFDSLIWGDPISRRRSDLQTLKGIKDSKKLSEKQREEWYKILTNHPGLEWAVALVCSKTIDRINIFEADKLAMRRAICRLQKKVGSPIDYLIIDGNFTLDPFVRGGQIKQQSIIKADEKVFLCMAASIIAKVTRDRIMRRAHKKYPQYGFDRHKGYGTKEHFEAIKKYGPCEIHRLTFEPVKSSSQKSQNY